MKLILISDYGRLRVECSASKQRTQLPSKLTLSYRESLKKLHWCIEETNPTSFIKKYSVPGWVATVQEEVSMNQKRFIIYFKTQDARVPNHNTDNMNRNNHNGKHMRNNWTLKLQLFLATKTFSSHTRCTIIVYLTSSNF